MKDEPYAAVLKTDYVLSDAYSWVIATQYANCRYRCRRRLIQIFRTDVVIAFRMSSANAIRLCNGSAKTQEENGKKKKNHWGNSREIVMIRDASDHLCIRLAAQWQCQMLHAVFFFSSPSSIQVMQIYNRRMAKQWKTKQHLQTTNGLINVRLKMRWLRQNRGTMWKSYVSRLNFYCALS